MGRWKLGSNGAYYEPNDDGPDQVTPPPDQVAAMQAAGQPVAMPDSVQPMMDQQIATGLGPAGQWGGSTVPAMDGSGQSQWLPMGDYATAKGPFGASAGSADYAGGMGGAYYGVGGPGYGQSGKGVQEQYATGSPWANAIAGAIGNYGMPKQAAHYGMTGGVPGSSNQGTMAGLYQTLGPSFGRGRKPQY